MAALSGTAILLAGGRSVRMGRDKATLEWNGETLVERHLRQLRAVGVDRAVVVSNPDNDAPIRARTRARTVLQRGPGMSAAVRTGLEAAGTVESAWVVCVNDIIADSDYRRIADSPVEATCIVIPTRVLDRVFIGGCLELGDAGRVLRIVEKPLGGCPPGAAANIMVHRWCGAALLRRLAKLLADGIEYEAAINALIGTCVCASAVPVESWVAIKTPDDFAHATRPAMPRSDRDATPEAPERIPPAR